jgi:hypothetical protein
MTVYYDIRGTLVSNDELLEHSTTLNQLQAGERREFSLGGQRVISSSRRPNLFTKLGAAAAESAGNEQKREFVPIGFGKPLTLWIASAYSGKLPPKPGGFGKKRGALLTSAVKSWSYNDAKPRGINFLKQSVARNTEIAAPAATEMGTPIAFYSPAVAERSLITTFEIAFDNVDEPFWNGISQVLQGAGALPVFASASPYLLAAGAILNIGAKLANGLLDGSAEFQANEVLNIDQPGIPAKEGYRVVTRSPLDLASLSAYGVVDGVLRKKEDGTPYQGDTPYLVVALDGKADSSLEGFAPAAASAALLQKFYNIRENGETTAETLLQALQLFNDFRFRKDADALAKKLADPNLPEDEKAALKARYDAIVKNIVGELLKPKPTT